MKSSAPTVLCFGEILWDFLPSGLFAGGAPFNFAFHLHELGLDARPVSAVGRDLRGDELLRRLHDWKIPTDLVARHAGTPTGYVRARIAPAGDAHYDITRDVAWDRIVVESDTVHVASHARALVFGSLALRSPNNRDALTRVLGALATDALRAFDVNLRPPFDALPLVREIARCVTLLKLNAAEAARLAANESETPGREETHARAIADATGCATVCVTAGARGAGILRDSAWTWEKGRAVVVADTVGAGDAFLAALVAGLLAKEDSDAALLARACRLGEWVATQRGGTPSHPREAPAGDA